MGFRGMSIGTGQGLVGVLFALLLAGLVGVPVQAAPGEDLLADLSRDQRRQFQAYSRLYCRQFFHFEEGRFVLLPTYVRSRENSSGRTYDQAKHEMTRTKVVGAGKEIKVAPPTAEVIVSARVIPAVDVGHYGFVNSVVVEEIIDEQEMIVKAIELIPESEIESVKAADAYQQERRPRGVSMADHRERQAEVYANHMCRRRAVERQQEAEGQTYRLMGFDTSRLVEGETYYGPKKKGLQVAVVSTGVLHDFVLVNYADLKPVRTREFAEALAYVRLEPTAFIELVRGNREELKKEGDKASLLSIYRRFYNRYRPKELVAIATGEVGDGAATRPQPEPKPQVSPEPGVRPEPHPEPQPQPESVEPEQPEPVETQPEAEPKPQVPTDAEAEDEDEEEDEDDWDEDDWDEEAEDAPKKPTFFGIPL